jgi:arginyl-tRNA synthetase
MKEFIQQVVRKSIEALQQDGTWSVFVLPEIEVTHPKNEQFGDYTTNIALILAKLVGKSPMEIAETLKDAIVKSSEDDGQVIQKSELLETIEVVKPGYINFTLSQEYFAQLIEEINDQGKSFGDLKTKEERVMIEYSQLNSHKEFHIGHLRNVFVGNALVRIFGKAGYQVMGVNYCGDTGTHVAKCLWGLVTLYKDKDIDAIENKAEFLGKVYSEASQKIAENPVYEDEFKTLQKRFDDGEADLVALWKKTKQWSLDEFDHIYQDLDVSFDTFFYESIEEQAGKKILPELLERGIVEKSDGAIIANLEAYNLGILVLMRKDGGILYGLKDIPLAKEKFEQYHIDRSIVVVDVRQSLYFKQLFKILELYGFHEKMIHIGYEFIALKDGGSMSSRKGNVVTARLLMDYVAEKVRSQFPESPNVSAISIGAIRFAILKHSASSRIDFDIDESVRLDGATGPYVQYAHARISSILEKAKTLEGLDCIIPSMTSSFHSKEISLLRELTLFPELVASLAESYEVHRLPHYAIRVADKFHSFYNDCKVIDESDLSTTQRRLRLVMATQIVLAEALRLIGVSAPERM